MKTKKEKKIVVYGYARVSTKEQSLDVQTNQIKDYCKLREFDLVNVYTDKATGANNDRSGFQEMLSMLKNNPLGVNAVVIPKLDRIGRDVKNLINLIEHFQDTGVELISIADAIDTTTPSGRLFFHINAAYSQFERERINERTQEGRDYAKARLWLEHAERNIDEIFQEMLASDDVILMKDFHQWLWKQYMKKDKMPISEQKAFRYLLGRVSSSNLDIFIEKAARAGFIKIEIHNKARFMVPIIDEALTLMED